MNGDEDVAAERLSRYLSEAHAVGLRAEANALGERAEEVVGTTAARIMLRRALDLDEMADRTDERGRREDSAALLAPEHDGRGPG